MPIFKWHNKRFLCIFMYQKKTLYMKRIIILFFLSITSVAAFSQQTGLWSETQPFSTPTHPGQTRTFAYRIPTNYSAAKKYKVFIALHGQGGSPTSFLTTMWQVYGQTSIV